MGTNLLNRLPRMFNLATGYQRCFSSQRNICNVLNPFQSLGLNSVVVSPASFVSRRFYGHDDVAHYRHLSLLRELGITDNAIPDCFYTHDEILQACQNGKLLPLSRVVGSGIKAAQCLKRYKFAVSLIEFGFDTDNFDKKNILTVAETVVMAFANNVIDIEKRDALIDKLKPFPSVFEKQLTALVSDNPVVVAGNGDVKSTANAAHFLRIRDLDLLTKLCNRQSVNLLGDVTRGYLLDWYESDPKAAPKLFELTMMYFIHNQMVLMDDEIFFNIPAFQKFPLLKKISATLEKPKCSHCGEIFETKPFFSPAEWALQHNHFVNFARTNTKKPYNAEMIKNPIKFGENLVKLRGDNPLPILLVDVANITYKKTYIGNIKMLPYFLEQLYTEFSVIGLFSKFALPESLGQFKKVKRFNCITKADDDLDLLLVLSVCGSNTYIISNDNHKVYLDNNATRNMIQSRKLFFSSQTRKVELPNELSPYIQRTKTGFHLPVKTKEPTAHRYNFYCCKGLRSG